MKGHDMIMMFSCEGKYIFIDMLPEEQYNTFVQLCNVCVRAHSTYFDSTADLDALESSLHQALTMQVLYFPFYMQTVSTTLLKHVVSENIKRFGPLRCTHNYAAEHIMGDITSGCHSSHHFSVEMMRTADLKENLVWVLMDLLMQPGVNSGSDLPAEAVNNDDEDVEMETVVNVLSAIIDFSKDTGEENEKDPATARVTYDRENGLANMTFSSDEHYLLHPHKRVRFIKRSALVKDKSITLSSWRKLLYRPVVTATKRLNDLFEIHESTRRRYSAEQYQSLLDLPILAKRKYSALSSHSKRLVDLNILDPSILFSMCTFEFFSVATIGRKKLARTQQYDSKFKCTSNDFVSFYSDYDTTVWTPDKDPCVRNGWEERPLTYGRVVSFVEVNLVGEGATHFAIINPIHVLFTDNRSGMQVAALPPSRMSPILPETIWFDTLTGFTTSLTRRDRRSLHRVITTSGDADIPLVAVPVAAILPRNVVPLPMHKHDNFKDLRRLMGQPPLNSVDIDLETLYTHLFYLGVFY
eukprot:Nk52_evm1s1698 gene=Nk52_evmTU1s1698